MKAMTNLINTHPRLILTLFFAGLLVLGLSVFRDYGLSWDEGIQRQYGKMVYSYITEGDEELLTDRHRHYGPAFQLLLYSTEKIFGLEDSRAIYLMRHLATFLIFWLASVFFYLLTKYLFASWKVGLLGAAFLVVSPRIFAHAFYNPKDIPFTALFIIGMYTLVRYLDRKTVRAAVVHSVVCAITIDIRIVGVMLPVITIISVALVAVKYRSIRRETRRIWLSMGVYVPVLMGTVVLLWPTLWHAPVRSFLEAFDEMRRFPWQGPVFYRGANVPSDSLPWHYAPLWMAITIPLSFITLFLAGVGVSVRSFFTEHARMPVASRRDILLILLWFFLPPAYLIVSRAVLYDGWRHLFFMYPAFLILTLVGMIWLYRTLGSRLRGRVGEVAVAALVLLVVFNLGSAATFMIRHHPHQNLYFNCLVGGIRGAYREFELDYWGLSYRQAMEHILKVDDRDQIRIHVSQEVGRDCVKILKPEDRKRLTFVDKSVMANYHLTTFRWQDRERASTEPFYTIEIDGIPIIAVYRVRFM